MLHHFLNMEIYQQDDGVFIICQKKYAENILAEFGMIDCKPMSTSFVVNENIVKEDIMSTWYGSLVGNLLYLIATRPKIMYASSLLFRFMIIQANCILGQSRES